MKYRTPTKRTSSNTKAVKVDAPSPKLEFFFEDEEEERGKALPPSQIVKTCKVEEFDFSCDELKELLKTPTVKQEYTPRKETTKKKRSGLQQDEDYEKIQTVSTRSRASTNTVKNRPVYNELTDEEFSDFSYDEDYRAYEKVDQHGLGNKKEKLLKIEHDEAAAKQQVTKKRRRGPERKVRTTITKEKLDELNANLKQFFDFKLRGNKPPYSLRELALRIGLSYSTTLHKASIFKKTKEIKPGKFLSSLTKKRKYKKSEECERYIEQALKTRPFYSAEALAKYILRQFRVSYPRAIIGRHLNEMGYSSNNIKAFPLEKNGAKCINLRKIYANILQPLLESSALIVYVDEAAFSKNLFRAKTTYTPFELARQMKETEEDYISIMVAMSSERIVYYHIREGFYHKQDFVEAIGQIYYSSYLDSYKYGYHSIFLVNDLHKIHYDNPQHEKITEKSSIDMALKRVSMKRIFLPPGSPQLNPVEIMIAYLKNLLLASREEITDRITLKEKIVKFMQAIAGQPTKRFFFEFEKWFIKAKDGESF